MLPVGSDELKDTLQVTTHLLKGNSWLYFSVHVILILDKGRFFSSITADKSLLLPWLAQWTQLLLIVATNAATFLLYVRLKWNKQKPRCCAVRRSVRHVTQILPPRRKKRRVRLQLQSSPRQQQQSARSPTGPFFYFLGGSSGGTIAEHASDMTLGWKDPHRSDREGGRGQWGEQERAEVKYETPDGGVNALGTPLRSAPHSNLSHSQPGRLSLWLQWAHARGYKKKPQKKKERNSGSYGGRLGRKCSAAKWACSTKKILSCTETPLTSPRLLSCSLARCLQRGLSHNRLRLTWLMCKLEVRRDVRCGCLGSKCCLVTEDRAHMCSRSGVRKMR